MKHLLFFLLAFVWMQSSASAQTKPAAKTGRIEVIFNGKTTFNELVKLRLDMAEKGISLSYSELKFDRNGGLSEIAFSVNCNDGFSGSAEKSNLNNKNTVGFYRDYEDKDKPFGTL